MGMYYFHTKHVNNRYNTTHYCTHYVCLLYDRKYIYFNTTLRYDNIVVHNNIIYDIRVLHFQMNPKRNYQTITALTISKKS